MHMVILVYRWLLVPGLTFGTRKNRQGSFHPFPACYLHSFKCTLSHEDFSERERNRQVREMYSTPHGENLNYNSTPAINRQPPPPLPPHKDDPPTTTHRTEFPRTLNMDDHRPKMTKNDPPPNRFIFFGWFCYLLTNLFNPGHSQIMLKHVVIVVLPLLFMCWIINIITVICQNLHGMLSVVDWSL